MDECEISLLGDMGAVNGEGDIAETPDGEPGNMFKAKAISMAMADRGDGTPDPVDA